MTAQDLIGQALAQGGQRMSLEVLGAHVLGISRARFLAQARDPLDPGQEVSLRQAYEALVQGTPLQYLTNTAWFWGRPFYVDDRVLIPRFDTEVLVDHALKGAQAGARVLDLCTGSGVVALTLKAERPDLQLFASDISAQALDVARKNAATYDLDLKVCQGDLFGPWEGLTFDLITANPPYISPQDYQALGPDVLREPRLALEAGPDGLVFYRRIGREAGAHLVPGGLLLLEIGWDQGPALLDILRREGFSEVTLHKDSQGIDRVVRAVFSG